MTPSDKRWISDLQREDQSSQSTGNTDAMKQAKDEYCISEIPNNSLANCVLFLLENSFCGWLDYCWTLRESWIFHLDVSFAADCSIPAVKVDFLIG